MRLDRVTLDGYQRACSLQIQGETLFGIVDHGLSFQMFDKPHTFRPLIQEVPAEDA
jgi:hypothetical protein